MPDIFLVKDFTASTDKQYPTYTMELVHGADKIIKLMGEAKEAGRKISIYVVGECLVDWS